MCRSAGYGRVCVGGWGSRTDAVKKEGVYINSPAKPWGPRGLAQGRKCPLSYRCVCFLQNFLDAVAPSKMPSHVAEAIVWLYKQNFWS